MLVVAAEAGEDAMDKPMPVNLLLRPCALNDEHPWSNEGWQNRVRVDIREFALHVFDTGTAHDVALGLATRVRCSEGDGALPHRAENGALEASAHARRSSVDDER